MRDSEITGHLRAALAHAVRCHAEVTAAAVETQPDSGERMLVTLAADALARLEQALDVAVRADADGGR